MLKNTFSKISHYINNSSVSVLLFGIFVFVLPFWRRMEFTTPKSFLDGRFIEYLTYSIFSFDVILTILLTIWFFGALLGKKRMKNFNWKIMLSFFSIVFFSFISMLSANYRPISAYYIFSLLIMFVVIFFMFNSIKTKKDIFLVLNFFALSMFLQSLVAIFQFLKNQSIGLLFFGEQLISPELNGIAKTSINGVKHIRAYGTFSHPNILALFLLTSLIVIFYLIVNYKDRVYRLFLFVASFFISLAIFFTFSRIVWLLTIGSIVFFSIKKNSFFTEIKKKLKDKRFIYILAFLIIIFLLFIFYFYPSIWWRINPFSATTWQSFQDRFLVIKKSLILIREHPLFGIGIGNFVIEIAYLLTGYPVWMAEPVHNVFLLILTEIGIFGLTSFIFMLYYIYKEAKGAPYFLKNISVVFLISMFFDHYFWDIRQAQYLLFIFIGFILVFNSIKETHDQYKKNSA